MLAGLVLAAASGARDWRSFDQLRAAVGAARVPAFNGTVFAKDGPCSRYEHMVHQYGVRPSSSAKAALHEADFYDLFGASCLNGWTMGNGAFAPVRAEAWNTALLRRQKLPRSRSHPRPRPRPLLVYHTMWSR